MNFDFETVGQDMLGAAQGVLKGEWPKARAAMEQVLAEERAALERIAQYRLEGRITDQEMQQQLEDEKVALQAGLAMVRVAAKKTLQDATNAALDVFWKAVQAAL